MSLEREPQDEFDARMRRVFAGIDTRAGFEERLRARVATIPPVPDAELRARADRRRERARLWLRREAWLNSATAIGIGAAAMALVWRHGPAVAHWVNQGIAAALDIGTVSSLAFVALGLGVWVILQRLSPR